MKITDSVLHRPGRSHATAEVRAALQPQIEALASAAPALARSGADAFGDAFFARLGVERRHLVIDPADPARWWSEQQGRRPIARAGADTCRRLMSGHAPLGEGDRLIVVSNVFDTTAPGLAVGVLTELLAPDPTLPRPTLLGLAGEGCSGFLSALHEAHLWLRAQPGARVLVLSCELSSPYFWSPQLAQALPVGSPGTELEFAL